MVQTIEIESLEMETGGFQSSLAINVSDLDALIVKFMVVISTPYYTIMDTDRKVECLLDVHVVGDMKMLVDTVQIRDDVSKFGLLILQRNASSI